MSTITATVSAANGADAVARVKAQTDKLVGFDVTGRVQERSARHGLWNVEVSFRSSATKAQRDDAWVVLTSYGISPSKALGSRWEEILGATA